MEFFLTAEERRQEGSTSYLEFYRGRWTDGSSFWNEDSLYIADDVMVSIGMTRLFFDMVKGFDPYEMTEVAEGDWSRLYSSAVESGGKLFKAFTELTPWAEDVFKSSSVFTILGL